MEVTATEQGIFNKLAENYSMIFDSKKVQTSLPVLRKQASVLLMCRLLFEDLTPLQFEPSEVFFKKKVTLTCGPPPSTLGFSSNTKAEWRLNDSLIHEDDLHKFETLNGAAILTISEVFVTDNGKKTTQLTEVKRLL